MEKNQQFSPSEKISEEPGKKQVKKMPSKKVILACFIVGIIFITIIVVGLLIARNYSSKSDAENEKEQDEEVKDSNGSKDKEETIEDEDTVSEEDTDTTPTQSDDTQQQVLTNSIIEPTESEVINGKITIKGSVTGSLSPLDIRLYDDDDNLLGQSFIEITGSDMSIAYTWESQFFINRSPETASGSIKVFPRAEGESSSNTASVGIISEVQETPDRIKLYSPLKYQEMGDSSVLFRGEMKDFFEATMPIRLKDESGSIIFTDHINATGDNYGQFSSFSKLVDYTRIPAGAGSEGTWEIYEVSMADGSETVLLTIPVSFGN